MWQDKVVEEIRSIREAYAKSFNDDLSAILADLQKQQAKSGRTVVNLSSERSSKTRWSEKTRELDRES